VPAPADDVCVPDLSVGIDVIQSSGAATVASIQGSGGLEISGGSLDVTGTADPLTELAISGGSLGGPGTVRIGNRFVWSGGTMGGSGQTTVDPSAIMTLAADATLGPRTLNLDGLLDIPGDSSLRSSGAGLLHVRSTGAIIKSGGSGGSVIEPTIDNDGIVRLGSSAADTANLSLRGGSATSISTGSFGQPGPGTVRFDAGAYALGPATFTGGVEISGADITIPAATTLTYPSVTQTAGTVTVPAGATLGEPGSTFTLNGGVLRGTGTAGGDVVNSGGTLKPGSSPGTFEVGGDYTQTATGALQTEVAGVNPGSGYDRLVVDGTATLDGGLDIRVDPPFDPPKSSSYDVLTASTRVGTFSDVGGTDLTGKHYEVDYLPGGVRVRVEVDVPPVPSNSVAPTIPADAETGDDLTCDPGEWTNGPTSFAYEWLRDGSGIRGGGSQTYTVKDQDVGHALRCAVVATNTRGSGEPAFSNTLRPSMAPTPRTRITGGPGKRTTNRAPAFRFSSDDRSATFLCRLDHGGWKQCSSPLPLRSLAARRHVFRVRAVSAKGIEDPTPAVRRFTVVRPKR
jgi:hypothetical protein